jgi:hypothetical protein
VGGARAVDPLLSVLGDTTRAVRVAAAQGLADLYHAGALDDAARKRILAARARLAEPHTDRDCEGDRGCTQAHTDQGIGVVL